MNHPHPDHSRKRGGPATPRVTARGFTLVELLVSTLILTVLVVVLASIVNQTSSMWHYTASKVEQFRGAREGFEAMTRRLSQATLNTYWDYDDPNLPKTYLRQSELRFISGPGITAGGDAPPRPTHGIFFFAPLGFVVPADSGDTTAQNYEGLGNLLNTWGYFIEYRDDSVAKPTFVNSAPRNRFRLMEFMQPSQAMNLYALEKQAGGNTAYTATNWFLDPINTTGTSRPAHVLAENIIALVLLPKLAPEVQAAGHYTAASLAPGYLYDSTGTNMNTLSDPNLNPKNQLPPIIQATMVAIDETSALRMSAQDVSALQAELGNLFTDPAALDTDLGNMTPPPNGSLAQYLLSRRINYRIFTSEISIKGAKWSTNQKN